MGWKHITAVVADPFARQQLAAAKAVRVAARPGARLTLFNAFMIPQPTSDAPLDSSEQIIAASIRQRRARLKKLAEALRASGAPPIRIKIDVLVMGAVSRRLLERPVIGSTAERVIDHLDCDLFIVKPAGFRTPVRRSR